MNGQPRPQPVAINVAIGGVLATGVSLAALLWPGITPELQVAIIAFGNAVILAATAIVTWHQVTPTSDPVLPAGTTVTTPQGQPAEVVPTAPPPT
jgi:hypothetical protein